MKDIIIANFGEIFCGLCGVIGIVVTAVLGYIYFRKKENDKFSVELFREYEKRSQELAKILQDLLSLSFVQSNYTDKQLDEISRNLSIFYFKYYLTLPAPLLRELQCLYTCLYHKGKVMYSVSKDDMGMDKQVRVKKKDEYEYLMKDSSILLRHDVNVLREFYQRKSDRLPDTFIKFQARHIITVMHDCWNIKEIHNWRKCLAKETLAQKERRYRRRQMLTIAYWKKLFQQ